jgi:chitin disaccharide deacetylase
MKPNPLLEKLGLSEADRAVIIHADDVGMCHASVAAYKNLVERGSISSASAMVPCPWFPAIAAYCVFNRGLFDMDMGVHLTLTSEWEAYRWGPVSTRDPASGLIDEKGCFHQSPRLAQLSAQPDAVHRELCAQIEWAVAQGIDVTHIDSHMRTIFNEKLLPIYHQVAREYQLPVLMIRGSAADLVELGVSENSVAQELAYLRKWEDQGLPLLDQIKVMSLKNPENRLRQAHGQLQDLHAGISNFIFHPAIDTLELRAITPDWRCRVADFELLTSEAWQGVLEDSGVHVIGWRAIRDLLRR